MSTAYLWCNLKSCTFLRTLWPAVIISPNIYANFNSVTFVPMHTSQFGSFGKWVNKVYFLRALFEASVAGTCAEGRGPGGGISTSAGEPSVELDASLDNPTVSGRSHAGILCPLASLGRTQLVSASGHPELGSGDRFFARLGQPRECGCLC